MRKAGRKKLNVFATLGLRRNGLVVREFAFQRTDFTCVPFWVRGLGCANRALTTSATCKASNGGTAFPTCLNCSVRGPSKR